MKLKVISLNVWQGGNLFDEIVEFLLHENPDILLLQEVYNSKDAGLARNLRCFDVLAGVLNMPHRHFAPALVDNRAEGNIVQGNAIFSKFPITGSNVTFYDHPYREDYVDVAENFATAPRNLQHVQVDANATELNIFNIHGIWDLDGDNDSERRLAMSKAVVDAVSGKKHVVLAGDTNVKPETKTIRNIEKHLTSVFKDELMTSFNMRRKNNPGYASAVVDMMFVSQDFKVLEHVCPNIDISDHLPLIATLEFD